MLEKNLNTGIKEIRLRLPTDVVDSIPDNEIISMLLDKILTKVEYYQSRCKEMEEKYKMNFNSFKKKINNNKKEIFSDWDNFILWEGYMLGYKEWNKKYKELKQCIE